MKGYALPALDRLELYVPVPYCWVSWEPSVLLLLRSSSVVTYHSGLMLCTSERSKEHVWLIEIRKFLVSALVSFDAVACNDVSISKTADKRLVAEGLGALTPILDRMGS